MKTINTNKTKFMRRFIIIEVGVEKRMKG